jgi:hypothetical protein
MPVLDMLETYHEVRGARLRLIGPNCPGVITPGQCKIGIMPGHIHKPGRIGVISRSGTLTYEIVHALTSSASASRTCVGIGGDPIIGTNFRGFAFPLFNDDPGTDAMVMVGEIGGDEEERTAEFIGKHIKKPVFAYIVGATAPEGQTHGPRRRDRVGRHGHRGLQDRGFQRSRRPGGQYHRRSRRHGGLEVREVMLPGTAAACCRCEKARLAAPFSGKHSIFRAVGLRLQQAEALQSRIKTPAHPPARASST